MAKWGQQGARGLLEMVTDGRERYARTHGCRGSSMPSSSRPRGSSSPRGCFARHPSCCRGSVDVLSRRRDGWPRASLQCRPESNSERLLEDIWMTETVFIRQTTRRRAPYLSLSEPIFPSSAEKLQKRRQGAKRVILPAIPKSLPRARSAKGYIADALIGGQSTIPTPGS